MNGQLRLSVFMLTIISWSNLKSVNNENDQKNVEKKDINKDFNLDQTSEQMPNGYAWQYSNWNKINISSNRALIHCWLVINWKKYHVYIWVDMSIGHYVKPYGICVVTCVTCLNPTASSKNRNWRCNPRPTLLSPTFSSNLRLSNSKWATDN